MKSDELKQWRKRMGFTQEQAGIELGITRHQIGRLEKGETQISKAIELACNHLEEVHKKNLM